MKTPTRSQDWPPLLTHVEQALELPLAEPSAATSTGLPAEGLHPGALIGPWRLVRELGQGGMGVVWLAERADSQVALQVALKLPHAGPGQGRLAQRMQREGRILATLEHPNIARLYDVGVTDGGTPYLAMAYVPGDNLLAFADARRLGIRQRLQLFLQVLRAVQYAHAKLLLHRDLKPGNIRVSAQGEVKLLDLGFAKMLADDTDPADETEPTGLAGLRMTAGYASPEQLAGQRLGTASDVYSLGVLLHELLTGQRPHAQAGRSLAQIEAAVLGGEPQPPSRVKMGLASLDDRATTAAAWARLLRGDLDAMVLHALARVPERRYASVQTLAADVAAWLDRQPVSVRAPSVAYRWGRFVLRHRWSVGLVSAAALALLGAAAVAVVQEQAAQRQASRAAAARDFMFQLFDEAAPHRIGGAQLSAMQLLEQGRRDARDRLKSEPLLQAELLAGIGETQYAAGERPSADAAFSQAAALFNRAGDATQEASARISRLKVNLEEGHYAIVDQLQRDLVPLMPAIRDDRRLYVRWLNAEGRYAQLNGNAVEERRYFRQCIAAADMGDAWQAAMAFDAHLGLAASLLAERGDLKAHEAELAAAAAIAPSPRHLTEPIKRFRLTEARIEQAWYLQQGIELTGWLPGAIAECEAVSGRDDARCVLLKRYLLRTLNWFGPSAQALALVRELDRSLEGPGSPDTRYGTALQQVKALAMLGLTEPPQASLRVLTDLLSPRRSVALPVARRIQGLVVLGQARLRAGDFAEARQWFARAEALVDQAGGERERAQARLRYARGLLAQATGDHQAALALMGPHCLPADRRLSHTLFGLNCVRSLAATGQISAAAALARAAVPRLTEGIGPDAPNTVAAKNVLAELEAAGGYRGPPWRAEQIFFID